MFVPFAYRPNAMDWCACVCLYTGRVCWCASGSLMASPPIDALCAGELKSRKIQSPKILVKLPLRSGAKKRFSNIRPDKRAEYHLDD